MTCLHGQPSQCCFAMSFTKLQSYHACCGSLAAPCAVSQLSSLALSLALAGMCMLANMTQCCWQAEHAAGDLAWLLLLLCANFLAAGA